MDAHTKILTEITDTAVLGRITEVPVAPCVKFRKYFEMRQCQKKRFKVLTLKSMRKFFVCFLSGQGKLLIYNIFGFILSFLLVRRSDLN